ncbi:MAG: hypothetical protein WKF84_09065 [Pyrinomonadaceae bacterium]
MNVKSRIVLKKTNPATNEGLGVSVTSMRKEVAGDYSKALLILLGAAGFAMPARRARTSLI